MLKQRKGKKETDTERHWNKCKRACSAWRDKSFLSTHAHGFQLRATLRDHRRQPATDMKPVPLLLQLLIVASTLMHQIESRSMLGALAAIVHKPQQESRHKTQDAGEASIGSSSAEDRSLGLDGTISAKRGRVPGADGSERVAVFGWPPGASAGRQPVKPLASSNNTDGSQKGKRGMDLAFTIMIVLAIVTVLCVICALTWYFCWFRRRKAIGQGNVIGSNTTPSTSATGSGHASRVLYQLPSVESTYHSETSSMVSPSPAAASPAATSASASSSSSSSSSGSLSSTNRDKGKRTASGKTAKSGKTMASMTSAALAATVPLAVSPAATPAAKATVWVKEGSATTTTGHAPADTAHGHGRGAGASNDLQSIKAKGKRHVH